MILNGNIVGNDSFTSTLATGTNYDNYIINGAETDKGALIVDENTELTNSIINGYNTAVYIDLGKTLTATGTTFNGGGLKNDVAVIKEDDGDNSLNILGNSIINGAVDLGNGTDTLAIANTVQINGNLKNEGNFFKGYYEGIYKEYSDTGKLIRKAIYRDKEMTNIENY